MDEVAALGDGELEALGDDESLGDDELEALGEGAALAGFVPVADGVVVCALWAAAPI